MATTTRKTAPKAAKSKPISPTAVAAASATSVDRPSPYKKADKPEPYKKKELIDKVVLRSGMKRRDVKPVVDVMLSVLAEAISTEDELSLRPLGKIKVTRRKEAPNANVTICKVRQPTGSVKPESA